MKQEQKELLLKELCARLQYGVVVGTTDNDGTLPNFWSLDLYNRLTEDVTITNCEVNADRLTYFCDVRPYLFPLTSMTEKQKQYLKNRFCYDWNGEPYDLWKCQIEIGDADELIDFFHKNHLDYRGLIPKKLAIDVTNLNIY